jgi:hypothetical protein
MTGQTKNISGVPLEEMSPSDFLEGKFKESVENIGSEIWGLSEDELENFFDPTPSDIILRKNLHNSLSEIKRSGVFRIITHEEIYRDACTRQNFYEKLGKNKYRIAWLLIPFKSNEAAIATGFHKSLSRAFKILDLPVTEKSAPVILKTLEFFANRHLGPVIQRIEQKSMNVSVSSRSVGEISDLDPELMLQKYTEAKAKLVSAPANTVEPDEPE